MSTKVSSETDIIELFKGPLLQWAGRKELNTFLASIPFQPHDEIRIKPTAEPLLKVQRARRFSTNLIGWPSAGLHAQPNPLIGFVLKGEADLSVGVTDAMVNNANIDSVQGMYQARMREKGVLIYPSNVPMADGTKPHWDEVGRTPPDNSILWINIVAEGAVLHTCHTVKSEHILGECRFILNTRLLLLIEAIIEELQTAPSAMPSMPSLSTEIVDAHLQVLLLNIFRSLVEQQSHGELDHAAVEMVSEGIIVVQPEVAMTTAHIVNRTCQFIQGHLGQQLSVAEIARFAFVSPAQLNRLFRAELNQSVMGYVNDQRVHLAKRLLASTNLPVSFISDNVGFTEPAYFSRMFRQKTSMTPGEFRRLSRLK